MLNKFDSASNEFYDGIVSASEENIPINMVTKRQDNQRNVEDINFANKANRVVKVRKKKKKKTRNNVN